MKNIFLLLSFLFLGFVAKSQSNPKIDRPVQQCINDNKDKVQKIDVKFSIGYWLYKLVENCDKLQKTSGRGGGPQVGAILDAEKELDDLIAISEVCGSLNNPKIKTLLQEMKQIYVEKQDVQTYHLDDEETTTGNLFEDDKEVTTMSFPRPAAGKLKSKAEKVRKLLD